MLFVEDAYERAHSALECRGEADQRSERGELRASLDRADVILRDTGHLCELDLCEAALRPQFAQMLAEQRSGWRHRCQGAVPPLTFANLEYMLLFISAWCLNMIDPTVTKRIRSIFLHHEARVTIGDAARLLGR
jgi:hypothetical protein